MKRTIVMASAGDALRAADIPKGANVIRTFGDPAAEEMRAVNDAILRALVGMMPADTNEVHIVGRTSMRPKEDLEAWDQHLSSVIKGVLANVEATVNFRGGLYTDGVLSKVVITDTAYDIHKGHAQVDSPKLTVPGGLWVADEQLDEEPVAQAREALFELLGKLNAKRAEVKTVNTFVGSSKPGAPWGPDAYMRGLFTGDKRARAQMASIQRGLDSLRGREGVGDAKAFARGIDNSARLTSFNLGKPAEGSNMLAFLLQSNTLANYPS